MPDVAERVRVDEVGRTRESVLVVGTEVDGARIEEPHADRPRLGQDRVVAVLLLDRAAEADRRVEDGVRLRGEHGAPGGEVEVGRARGFDCHLGVVAVHDRRARRQAGARVARDLVGRARNMGIARLARDAVDRGLDDDRYHHGHTKR